jgi:hypothetical protein
MRRLLTIQLLAAIQFAVTGEELQRRIKRRSHEYCNGLGIQSLIVDNHYYN